MGNPPSAEDVRKSALFAGFAASFRTILRELAGWSAERADEKLEQYVQNCGFRAWFGHDSPAYFAAAELVPAGLTGPDAVQVRARICTVIEMEGNPSDPFHLHEDSDYDWETARDRVASILRGCRTAGSN